MSRRDRVKIVLRALRHDSDADALVALFSDADTVLWNPGPDAGAIAAWCESNNEAAADFMTRAVADAHDDRLLGVVSIFNVDAATRTAEIGYRTVPAERGRGVAAAALRAATRQGFADFPEIARIELFHAVENAAACAVASGAGYVLVQTTPASHVYGDGVAHDEHRHVIELPSSG